MDGIVTLWDTVKRTQPRHFQAHAGAVRSVALDASGTLLATAGDDAHWRLWDVRNGALRLDRDPGEGTIFQVALSHDGRTCGSGASNGTVRIFQNGEVVLRIEPFRRPMKWREFEYEPPGE